MYKKNKIYNIFLIYYLFNIIKILFKKVIDCDNEITDQHIPDSMLLCQERFLAQKKDWEENELRRKIILEENTLKKVQNIISIK